MATHLLAQLPTSVRSPRGTLEISRDGSLVFRTEALPAPPVLFRWTLEVEGIHSADRAFRVSAPLESETLLCPDPPRGRYAVTVRWELSDTFGFFRWSPRRRWTGVLTVPPDPMKLPPPGPPQVVTGTRRPRKTGFRAGDPFDVRRYADGDDLRRIHWPLYAHSGHLFVRTADPSPPPAGRWHLILDTEAASDEALDRRLGALASWISRWDALGLPWTIELPAQSRTLRTGQDWTSELAALTPAPLPEGTGGLRGRGFLLITGPSSQGRLRWTGLPSGAGLSIQPVVVPDSPPAARVRRRWWSRR